MRAEKVGSFMRFNRIFWLMLPLVLSSCGGGSESSGGWGPSFSTSSETGKSSSESSSEKASSSSSESSGEMSHTYSPLWSYDEEHHWHACVDEGYEHLRIDEAVHVLYTKEEIQPTFEQEGKIVQACHICDYIKTETLPVKEHTYEDYYIYLDEEHHFQYCMDPGYYDLRKIEPHEFTHEVVAPTYEEEGYTKHTCEKCGYEYRDNETARLEHHYGNWYYDEYYHYGQCLDEGYEYLSISEPHDIVEEVIEPTFEDQGYTHRYCATGCGYEVFYKYTDPKPHNYSDQWQHDEEHHWRCCIDEGYETLIDGYGEHTLVGSNWYYESEPSYEHPGWRVYPCGVCGYVFYREIVDQYIDGFRMSPSEDGKGYFVSGTKTYGVYSEMTVPATYNDLPVVGIGPNAFKNNTKVEKLNLPDSVTYIGEQAFAYSAIREIALPDAVTTIGKGAFQSSMLESITLSKELLSIGDNAFDNTIIEQIEFPNKLQAIGTEAFMNSCIKEFNLPNSLLTIGERAFAYTPITEFYIPDSVIETGFAVFMGCGKLEKLSLPYAGKTKDIPSDQYSTDNVLGHYFGNTSYADSFKLSQKFSHKTEDIADFYFPTSLREVIIRGGSLIPHYFCWRMTHVTSVYIGKSINFIDYYAFYESSITNIYYGGDMTDWANVDSSKGTPFKYNDTSVLFYTEDTNGEYTFDDKKFSLPRDIVVNFCKAIPNMYLMGLRQITSITIMDGVESIGEFAFAYLPNLTTVSLPDTVTSIAYNALTGCSNIRYLKISKDAGYVSLGGMKNLETIILSRAGTGHYELLGDSFWNEDGVRINQYPQDNDTVYYRSVPASLKYVTILGGDIGTGYFSGCTSIQKVNFGEDMGTYGVSLFRNTAVQEITFENYPYNDSSHDLANCKYPLGKAISKRASNNSTKTVQLFPEVTADEAHKYWKYTDEEINNNTVYWPNTLKKITINNGYLGKYALLGLKGIEELTLGAGCTLPAGSYCCCFMEGLKTLNLEAGITVEWNSAAFNYTRNLETINFKGTPEQFEEIRVNLFLDSQYTVNYIE